MTLATWQHAFLAHLTADEAPDAAPANAGAAPTPNPALALADPRGLAVYRTNYHGQLHACLAEIYPHTRAWLGEDAFHAHAAAHIAAHPPTHWTLDAWPESFPAALRAGYPDDAEVADLAALEWHLSAAFAAPDAAPLAVADLAGIAWESARLRLVPAATLLPLASNAPAIWSALAAGETPPAAAPPPGDARLLVIWRQDFTCCFRALDAAEQALVPHLTRGLSFNEVCARLVASHGDEAGIALAGTLLARWAAEALVIAEA